MCNTHCVCVCVCVAVTPALHRGASEHLLVVVLFLYFNIYVTLSSLVGDKFDSHSRVYLLRNYDCI